MLVMTLYVLEVHKVILQRAATRKQYKLYIRTIVSSTKRDTIYLHVCRVDGAFLLTQHIETTLWNNGYLIWIEI